MNPNTESGRGQVAQLSPPGEKHVWFTYSTGDRPLEGYTIKRGIGAGGFGEVYYAVSDGGKEVALKQIQRHLDVELRGVSQCLNLKHPNLVVLYDVKRSDRGENWVVMEFVSGENLAEVIERHPQGMPVQDVLRLLRGICDGVGYLHEHGIVHRDLKPGNIFIENDLVKIGDYGLAKFISASRRSGQTESVGTVHYMAPELAHGRYGKEIDLYAVGVILHEMLTGRVPFDGQSPGEILMKHLTAQPETSVLPPAFQPIVARLLAKAPEARYSSFGSMLADLDACLEGRPLAGAVVPPVPNLDAAAGAAFAAAHAPRAQPGAVAGGRRVPSLQFWMDSVHAGFSTAEGIIRFTGDALALEFRVKPLGMVNMAVQEVRIPMAEIDSLQLRENWLNTKMLISTIGPHALANLPTTGISQATLRLARTDRDAARQFVAAVNDALRAGVAAGRQGPVPLQPAEFRRYEATAGGHGREQAFTDRTRTERIVRHRDDRIWLGVCSGLAARIGIDPVPIRIFWVLCTFGFPPLLLAYLLLAVIIPESSEPSPIAPGRGRIRRLVRPRRDRRWAGVCGGIAAYFGIDPIWIRILTVGLALVSGFVPVLALYLLLCWAMPASEMVVSSAVATPPRRIGESARHFGRVILRLPVALACGGGVGAIVGATCQMLGRPWMDETAAFLGVGSGLVTAAVTLVLLCYSLGRARSVWPALATLMLGAGTGLSVGGYITMIDSRGDAAAFGGVGTGLIAAGFAGYLLYSALGRALGWRWLFQVLFLGGGAGFITAAAGTLLGARDTVIVLSSLGAGLLTLGGLACTLIFGGWAERLRPMVLADVPAGEAGPSLKRTMTWYGADSRYRPIVQGASLFVTVLLAAWFAAYAVFWLAGSRQSVRPIFAITPAPMVVEWEVNRFGGHSAPVHAVAFDDNGKYLATGDGSGLVKLWDLETNAEIRSFTGHTDMINALAFHPDGTRLAAAANCNDVRIWDAHTGESVCTVQHPGPVKAIAFSPDGTKIATGSVDDAVRLFDATTGQLVKQFFGCKANIEAVAFLPDGVRLMGLGHHDQMIRIWDMGSGRQLKPLSAPNAWLITFIVSPDGEHTAARDISGTVYQWHTDSGNRLTGFSVGGSSSARVLSYSTDGHRLLAPDWPNVQLHEASTGRVVCTFKGHTGSLTALTFHPDGDSFVSAGTDTTVRLWEIPSDLRQPRHAVRRAHHVLEVEAPDLRRILVPVDLPDAEFDSR